MQVTDKDPSNSKIIELLIELGKTYLDRGDFGQAIEKFKTAIELGANEAKVYLNLSKAYILKEQFDDESQRIFEKSLEFDPENAVLNVILSQIYLRTGREDELAMKVFRTALKYNPNNADQIRAKMVRNSFEQGDIVVARELMEQFQSSPEQAAAFLPLYIPSEWKHQGFDRVTKYLKRLIQLQPDEIFYRWLLLNFLQAHRQSLQPFQLSVEDLKLCLEYLEKLPSLNRLFDIYLYPAIEQMLVEQSNKLATAQHQPIDEYEIFLSENALDNIWEKGLHRDGRSQRVELPQLGAIWDKIRLWNGATLQATGAVSSTSELPLQDAAIVQVLKFNGIAQEQISQHLSTGLVELAKSNNSFVRGYSAQDGFILFWNDYLPPVRLAIHLIQELDAQGVAKLDHSQVQCLIHSRTEDNTNNKSTLEHELQFALTPLQLEQELLSPRNHIAAEGAKERFQVLITATMKEKLEQQGNYTIEPAVLPLAESFHGTPPQVFQLRWDNSFAKIRHGKIQQIGRFKLVSEMNQNSVFLCFKAVDTLLDRLVVLKILNPDYHPNHESEATLALFLSEAKALGKISHPNIAMIYDIGMDQNFCFLAREYVEGVPLGVQRSINKKISVQKTLAICIQIAQTLQFMHQRGICHGKLQPNNIFLINGTEVKITDFQFPSLTLPVIEQAISSFKSISYSPPEQIDSTKFDAQSDIFSLGVVMYELFTNHHPFYEADRDKTLDNIRNKDPQPPSELNRDLPAELDAVIFKAIEKIPQHRYPNMAAMVGELTRLLVNRRPMEAQ